MSPILIFASVVTFFAVDHFSSHATALAAVLAMISAVFLWN
jgi:hypothetical protein